MACMIEVPRAKNGRPIPKAYRDNAVGVTDPHLKGTVSHLDKYQYDYRVGQYEQWFGVFQTMLYFRRKKDADWVGRNIADNA